MLNAKEYFNQLDATLALEELGDEVAATCSGGVALLYQDDNFKGRGPLRFYDGESDLRKWNFNDQTSSIKIEGNELWAFYKDINFKPDGKPEGGVYLGNGSYTYTDLKNLGFQNDSISSLIRVA